MTLPLTPHAEVYVLLELPFALNDVRLSVTVPIPTDYLHSEDRAITDEPAVWLALTNLDDVPSGFDGMGILKFFLDNKHEALAERITSLTALQPGTRTLVQARTTSCRLVGEEDKPSDEAAILERVLFALNRVLHAYLVAFEDEEVHFLSPEHIVAPVVMSPTSFGSASLADARVLSPPGLSLRFHPRPATAEDLARFKSAATVEAYDHPIDTARLWLIDARRARVYGETDRAIVALQTSAERLLFGAHQLILVDEGLNEEELRERQLATPFSGLVTNELPNRLGGNWSISGKGKVADYWSHLYEARNVITHAGYRLHRKHVSAAFDAYDGLEGHLIARALAHKRRFPRLAFGLLGGVGLAKRGELSSWLRGWAKNMEADPWPFWRPKPRDSPSTGDASGA
jgi:hypothetical protein